MNSFVGGICVLLSDLGIFVGSAYISRHFGEPRVFLKAR